MVLSQLCKQSTVTTDEDAIYALYAAVSEDRIWNINKLSQLDHNLKSTTKTNHSTPLTVHLSLHDEDQLDNQIHALTSFGNQQIFLTTTIQFLFLFFQVSH